jgi:xylan 1,4-beta-xylosidase
VAARWRSLGRGAVWPDDDQWRELATRDSVDELHPPRRIDPAGGVAELAVELPMPAISCLALRVA